ncbi:YycH family regulatory protein [Brevibacillus ginsengisoli]|uniref:YycH family regulatory protein n=1 Tax=Brevibacillus ginsengisoli TaxID=363854 RepID=UPI003CF4CD68
MNNWRETTKSVLLNVLVLTSFVLTWLLWQNQPKFELIAPTTYVDSKTVGQSKQLEELIEPESIVFHYGNDHHTRANANDAQFRVLSSLMSKWYFYDFAYFPLTGEKWQSLTKDKQGIEIQFRSTVPLSLISQFFTFRGEIEGDLKGINRIWLYYEEREDMVYALFLSDDDQRIIRARTVVSSKDLRESFLPLGKHLPEQILKAARTHNSLVPNTQLTDYWKIYYLPKESFKMRQFLYSIKPIPNEGLIQAFFLDPSLVRQVVERDGTVIFTDGTRSIQIRPGQPMMTYTDPVLPQQKENLTTEDKLRGAVNFINQHLGWTDTFRFERIEEHAGDGDVISFRQYLGAYPMISKDNSSFDEVVVNSEQGQIVSLKQPIIDLDRYINFKEWTIMSGPELYQVLRAQNVDVNMITRAYLAYENVSYQGYVELSPTWVVELANGSSKIIPAKSKAGGGKVRGLE